MLRKISFAIVVVAATIVTRPASANNSGVLANAGVSGGFFFTSVYQNATETWTFSTSNLSPGSDTVIHVQNPDDAQTGFIAGNDDYIGVASLVTVPPVGYGRGLFVIVRAYSTGNQGTCDLVANSSQLGQTTYSSIPFGGTRIDIGALLQGAHVMTAELQGGAEDTVMLTVRGNDPAHAVAYDDDDGTGLMSFVHNNEACSSCVVVLANFRGVGSSTTKLVWDDDADSTDYDSDGLGATLEGVLGTCPGPNPCPVTGAPPSDTDQDGLKDGAELLGVEDTYLGDGYNPVKLPAWGADPLQKDLFWEMDWKKCNDPNNCPNGDDSGQMGAGILADADFQTQRIEPMKALLGGTGIRVHLDVGRANTNPATWTEWGVWGGATRLDAGGEDACGSIQGSSPERAYMFHYGLGWPPDAPHPGSACWGPGPNFNSMINDPGENMHETAHGLAITHGGRPFAGSINFKPNYVSRMNYQYSDKGFSHGDFPIEGRVLNPTAVKENPGLGAEPPPGTAQHDVWSLALSNLRSNWCPPTAFTSGNCVNLSTGAVDWNRDGVFEAQNVTVQGAVNEAFYSRSARTLFYPVADGGFGAVKDPALTWVSVGGTTGDQLWIFGRDAQNRLAWARTPRTTLDAGCNAFTSFNDDFNNPTTGTRNCARFGDTANPPGLYGKVTAVSGSNLLAAGIAPGAAEYGTQILVVFNRTGETIKAKRVTISSISGSVTYGSDMTLPGSRTAAGDITALKTGSNEVTVWAPVDTPQRKLIEWRYTNGTWAGGQTADFQKWTEDNSDVSPMFGIGATRGYQDSSPTQQTYAAIPINPNGLVEFARKNAGANTWTRVTFTCTQGSGPDNFGCEANNTASSWAGTGGKGLPPSGTQPMARARPGLAYQKKAGQPNDYVGRFYMGINQGSLCSGPFGTPQTWMDPPCGAYLIMTEGNLASGTPPNRRLKWITPAEWIYQPNTDSAVVRGISLVDDLARDKNLRAAFDVFGGPNHGLFEPLADGIVNVDLKDFDDYVYLTGALRAALCMDGGTWPNTCVLPPSLP